MEFTVDLRPDPMPAADRTAVLADPGFGQTFTDHMVLVSWTPTQGWHDGRVTAYGPLSIEPATVALHYGQEIFEGLKAYRHPDGSVHSFRPEANAARFAASARRLALPVLEPDDFLDSLRALLTVDEPWVPDDTETSLYLRPFMFAAEPTLHVRPASQVTYCLIATPAGPYFKAGLKPVGIWISAEYSRASPGGTGAAKCAGNYAASLAAQAEAAEHGCEQVVFLDAVERRWVEEAGTMNLFLVRADGSIVTPELSGSILPGITRDSILRLATDQNRLVEERKVSVDELRSNEIVEVFATGTAAVVTPIDRLAWSGGELTIGEPGEVGPVTATLRRTLLDLQQGRAEDRHGWMTRQV